MAQSAALNNRNKYIDVRYHFVREKTADGTVSLQYLPTTSIIANFFTKALPAYSFLRFRSALGSNFRIEENVRANSDVLISTRFILLALFDAMLWNLHNK